MRGKSADARTDVYAFGAMLYELLSGKPVFATDNGAADAAMAHLSKAPDAPSVKAPRGWVTKEVDAFVLSLLMKDPAQRPKDATVLLEVIDSLGKPAASKAPATLLPEEKLHELVDALVAMPDNPEAAIALRRRSTRSARAGEDRRGVRHRSRASAHSLDTPDEAPRFWVRGPSAGRTGPASAAAAYDPPRRSSFERRNGEGLGGSSRANRRRGRLEIAHDTARTGLPNQSRRISAAKVLRGTWRRLDMPYRR